MAVVLLFRDIVKIGAKLLAFIGYRKLLHDLNKFNGIDRVNFRFAKKLPRFDNSLDKSLYKQFFQSPLPGILNQYDRCSMSHAVECRMPFMDYRIVEFIFSLPPESKVGKGYTKRVLREAMKGVVPDQIRLEKTKIGFNAPIVDWFKGPLKNFMLEQMQNETFTKIKYFDGYKIREEFNDFLKNPNATWDAAWKFWPPVHLTWWMKYNKIKIQ